MNDNAAAIPDDDSYIKELLTEEEIAALDDGDHLEDFADEDQDDAQALENATAQAEGDQAADAAAQAAQESEAATAQQVQDQQPEAEPATPQAQSQPEQLPNVDMAQLDQQIGAFKTQRQDLLDQFDDGDLTGAELNEALEGLEQQADEIKSQRAVAQSQIDAVADNWKSSVTDYLTQHEGLKAEGVLQRFDHAVRYVTGNPGNANLTYEQQLEKAHRQLLFEGTEGVPQLDPVPKPTPTPKKDGGEEAKPAAAADPKPPMRTPPPTLNSIPASEVGATGSDSPYAQLEALVETGDSDAIEAAMARLTPEQRDEFASMDIS
jgi:chemotaxis protein histidine kinase CheA